MESIEVSAKSEEEAVEIALAELGLSRSEVEVVIVKKGKGGLFGLGSGEVTVRVTPLELLSGDSSEVGGMAKEVLESVLPMIDISASVNLVVEGSGDEASVTLDIRGDDLGILIGRRGETLSSLQYLINLIVSRHMKSRVGVTVDVEGYKKRRHESLRLMAQRLAEQVRNTGRSVTLEPMTPAERRIIHLELRDNPYVTTQSIGMGEARKVAILSKGSNSG
ncbi:MAG TPA: KH domain-containing protein [Dehalococcoidia bacterium]|nr:KH domain-containing protein [Dehalococcoidia bacterium]